MMQTMENAVEKSRAQKGSERRGRGRVKLSQLVRVRPSEPGGEQFDEVIPTENICRTGVYFLTARKVFRPKMRLFVTYPYNPGTSILSEYLGEVVRVDERPDGTRGVAVHLISTINVHSHTNK
jgi:hypothetical protein